MLIKTMQQHYETLMQQITYIQKENVHTILTFSWINTPLGLMIAIANEQTLYLLEFIDRRNVKREIEQLAIKTNSIIIPGRTYPIDSIKQELNVYFTGSLKKFITPYKLLGTSFQQNVWQTLTTIPYGHTISYAQEATIIGTPSAYRAVANANGTNQLAIIIPCHRVINSNGKLGGYGAGISRKQWLLEHEKKHSQLSHSLCDNYKTGTHTTVHYKNN